MSRASHVVLLMPLVISIRHLLAVTMGKSAKIDQQRSRSRSHSIAMENRDLDIDLDDRNSTNPKVNDYYAPYYKSQTVKQTDRQTGVVFILLRELSRQ